MDDDLRHVARRNSPSRPDTAIWLVIVASPAVNGPRDPRRILDEFAPRSERLRDRSERLVDDLVDDPLGLVALEDEDDLARRQVHGVPGEAAFCRIERRPLLEQPLACS
jgi:hypothetical protein